MADLKKEIASKGAIFRDLTAKELQQVAGGFDLSSAQSAYNNYTMTNNTIGLGFMTNAQLESSYAQYGWTRDDGGDGGAGGYAVYVSSAGTVSAYGHDDGSIPEFTGS